MNQYYKSYTVNVHKQQTLPNADIVDVNFIILKKTVQNGSMNSPDNYRGDYYLLIDTMPAYLLIYRE